MRITLWATLDLLTTASNWVVKGIAIFWMLIVYAVLRPAHVQRSSFVALHANSVEGICSAAQM